MFCFKYLETNAAKCPQKPGGSMQRKGQKRGVLMLR